MKPYKIAAALLALTLLTGCGQTQKPEITTQPTETTAETVADTTAAQPQQPAVSGVAVETPYMTLHLPEDWKDTLKWEITQRGENYVITFCLTTTEKPVELFSLVLGPEDEEQGYYLGYLDQADGMISIYSVMNEQNPADWSDSDYAEICYQQERINELILQLHEDPGFCAS